MDEKQFETLMAEMKNTLTEGLKGGVLRPGIFEANPDAEGAVLDGKFKTVGEFYQAVGKGGDHPYLKTLQEQAGATGGFLVPEEFRVELLRLAVQGAIIRPRATVVPMGSEVLRLPRVNETSRASSVYGGIIGYWTEESGTNTASEPKFGQFTLTAHKLIGYTQVANELIQDSAIALESLLTMLFSEAIRYYEEDAFLNGSGVGQPLGILNSNALISVPKETGQAATTIVKENLDKMYSRMLSASRSRAIWIAHDDTIPQLLSLSQSVGTGGSPVMVANIANAPTFTIYGRPVMFTDLCQTLGTVGDIYFVDPSMYWIGDRQALTVAASEHVRFANGETAWRMTERLDGAPWLDSPLTPRNGATTLSPFLALATRS